MVEQVKKSKKSRSINFTRIPTDRYVKVDLDCEEIKELLGGRISGRNLLKRDDIKYPLYIEPLINTIDDKSRACHSSNVGKLHIMIKQRQFRNVGEWRRWYCKKRPGDIERAIDKVYNAIVTAIDGGSRHNVKFNCKFRKNMKFYIGKFINNLIIEKTFRGLKIQEALLVKLGQIMKRDYTWSTAKEDSTGIDGHLGLIPISIKPNTCQLKKKPGVKRVIYTIYKNRKGLSFTYSI